MKKALALDLDDLIFPFIDNLLDYANERRGTSVKHADVISMRFCNVWGGTDEEAHETVYGFFFDRAHLAQPVEGSVEAVAELSNLFELYIVTARSNQVERMTFDWLNAHFPAAFAGVHLCDLYGTNPIAKSTVCQQVDAVALVDDSLTNVIDVAESGRNGFLFGDFPWNAADELPELVTRVGNWNEAVDCVRELA